MQKGMRGDVGATGRARIHLESVQRRFWSKVVPWDDGCLEWMGTRRPEGYGIFGLGRRTDGVIRAHHFSYMLLCGAIPEGLTLDHLCKWTSCVHPDHLEAVTNSVNSQRAGWILKPTCKAGHPRTDENTYVDPRGWRECRPCRLNAMRRHRRKADAVGGGGSHAFYLA